MEENLGSWARREPGGGSGEAKAETRSRGRQPGGLRTFIDQGATFEGTLRLRETLRIDSEFKGEIVSEATVIVGESAGIEANIRAREVLICGAVVGNVVATRQLTLLDGGRLHGDIETPCLEIQKHALFNGRTSMTRPEATAQAGASKAPETSEAPSQPSPAPPVPAAGI